MGTIELNRTENNVKENKENKQGLLLKAEHSLSQQRFPSPDCDPVFFPPTAVLFMHLTGRVTPTRGGTVNL